MFERAPQLKVVANIAVGLNNIDLDAARAHQVRVAHTPHVLTEATADLAWALLLGGSRRIVEGDALARSGAWAGWEMSQLLGRLEVVTQARRRSESRSDRPRFDRPQSRAALRGSKWR